MNTQRNSQIADYVDGAMNAQQTARFERRMGEDSALRAEVEAWRQTLEATSDWLQAEPPLAFSFHLKI